MGSTSVNGYVSNTQAQLNYLIQWFHEWSEMQRNDFLPILSLKFGSSNYVNGLLPELESISNLDDKPPSIFQCRIKLFREWSENWNQTDKEQFLNEIKSLDPEFFRKYEEGIESTKQTSNQQIETSSLQD